MLIKVSQLIRYSIQLVNQCYKRMCSSLINKRKKERSEVNEWYTWFIHYILINTIGIMDLVRTVKRKKSLIKVYIYI